MSGYIILLLMAVSLLTGAVGGWDWTKDHYEANQEKALAAGIADYQKKQAAISTIDAKSATAQQAEQANIATLEKELTDERLKNHTTCQHSAALRKLLYQASLPPSGLSR
jgi:hypothetical protein